MDKRQKQILTSFAVVIIITAVAVTAMVELKNWINRSEAIRAMEHLSRVVLQYREKNGAIPAESYVTAVKDNLQGAVRLGELHYRARWIDFGSTADEILAYSQKKYHSLLFRTGYVVLRLDGRVEWMSRKTFEPLLASEQSPLEIELMKQ